MKKMLALWGKGRRAPPSSLRFASSSTVVVVWLCFCFAMSYCNIAIAAADAITPSSSSLTMTSIDCNGTFFPSSLSGEVIRFSSSVNFSNCVFFNHSQLYISSFSSPFLSSSFSSSSHSPAFTNSSIVVYLQNCSFLNSSSLSVRGRRVSRVQLDDCSFKFNSTLFIRSKHARVVISNSEFSHGITRHTALLTVVGGGDVRIQNCSFFNNSRTRAIKLLNPISIHLNCTITDSNFQRNYHSIYSSCDWTKVIRCNFSNNDDKSIGVISFGEGLMEVEDCSFVDNESSYYSVILGLHRLKVTRSLFKNNRLLVSEKAFSQLSNGAAIYAKVPYTIDNRRTFP